MNPPVFKLPSYIANELFQKKRMGAPEEVCGVIVITAPGVMEVVQIPNVADDPHRGFAFDPVAQLKLIHSIAQENMRLVAIWHSHLIGSGRPSSADLASAAQQDHRIVNLIIFGSRIFAFQMRGEGEEYRNVNLVVD